MRLGISKISLEISRRYCSHPNFSKPQAILKSLIVPLDKFDELLPSHGTIVDLGCGEGILTNSIASLRPSTNVIGVDIDNDKLEIASTHAPSNASFTNQSIFEFLKSGRKIDVIVFNDFLHHFPYNEQSKIVELACYALHEGGLLFVKEVDKTDKSDATLTKFFDNKLYPDDEICFRSADEWEELIERNGFAHTVTFRDSHFWPASRSIFVGKRISNPLNHDLFEEFKNEKNTGSNIFITGATGFIGSHLCEQIANFGINGKAAKVYFLCRHPGRQFGKLQNAKAVYGDLADTANFKDFLKHMDFVFHLAAEVKLTGGKNLHRNNSDGTKSLIDGLENADLTRFVFASTMGAIDRVDSDDCSLPLDESSPPNPLSAYGKTKLSAENLVKASKLPYSILRIPWAFGPRMTSDTHVNFLTNGVSKNKIFSKFNFPGKVSLLSVEDATKALLLLAEQGDATKQTYFVSTAKSVSLGELFQLYASVIGKTHKMLNIPNGIIWVMKKTRRYWPFQVQCLFNDVLVVSRSKIEALGFRDSGSIRSTLFSLAEYQENLKVAITSAERQPVTIVTGAANGIGKSLAEKLSERGHKLLLIDRDYEALEILSTRLSADFLLVDLNEAGCVAKIHEHLEEKKYRIDWLINNAGIGIKSDVCETSTNDLYRMININCIAVTSLTKLFLESAKIYDHGTLINIGSSAGFQPLPGMAVYAATKSYTQAFTMGVIGEQLRHPKVSILLVDPSGTNSKFQEKAGVRKSQSEKLLDPCSVAEKIITAAEGKKSLLTIGHSALLMNMIARILPRKYQILLWSHLFNRLR